MSLLFMDPCDSGDYAVRYSLINPSGGGGFSSVAGGPFTTGRMIRKTHNTGGKLQRVFTPSPTIVVGFWFTYDAIRLNFPAYIMALQGDAGATEHLSLVTGQAENELLVRRGTTAIATISGITYTAWHFCEIKATVDDTTGNIEVRIDNAVVANFTGDTRNGGTSTDLDSILFSGSQNNTNITLNWKDIYVLNTSGARLNDFLGPRRVHSLVATGAGATTGLTPSTGANWTCIDEQPAVQTDYVTGTPGAKDTYATADLPATASAVEAVQVSVFARRTDATPTNIKPVIRSGGTDYAPSSGVLLTTDTTTSTIWEQDPATAANWTVSNVNAAQHGAEVA